MKRTAAWLILLVMAIPVVAVGIDALRHNKQGVYLNSYKITTQTGRLWFAPNDSDFGTAADNNGFSVTTLVLDYGAGAYAQALLWVGTLEGAAGDSERVFVPQGAAYELEGQHYTWINPGNGIDAVSPMHVTAEN